MNTTKNLQPIFIALGSNMGNRHENLEQARAGLRAFLSDVTESLVYETEPAYVVDQPDFLNQVIMGWADLDVMDIFAKIKTLEDSIGRVKTFINGPRIIDIDILYYGQIILNTPELKLPHPGIQERLFVLEPLCEIAPDWACPLTKKTMIGLLQDLKLSRHQP